MKATFKCTSVRKYDTFQVVHLKQDVEKVNGVEKQTLTSNGKLKILVGAKGKDSKLFEKGNTYTMSIT